MNCPKCQEDTIVTNSVAHDYKNVRKVSGHRQMLIAKAQKTYSWWSDDFRVRLRKCKECDHEFLTIEIVLQDLADAFEDIREQGRSCA